MLPSCYVWWVQYSISPSLKLTFTYNPQIKIQKQNHHPCSYNHKRKNVKPFSFQSRITPVVGSWRPALFLTYALGRRQTGVGSSVMSATRFSRSRVVRIAYPPATAHMLETLSSWTWPWAKLGQAGTDGAKLPVGHQKQKTAVFESWQI